MKKLLLILSIFLFIILYNPIRADTIIDSVYAVPELDGNMCYNPDEQPEYLNTSSMSLIIGDLGEPWIPGYPPNSCSRSFISFELPQIPGNYQIDSVYIRLYQFHSVGNSNGLTGLDFPEWNIPGGDTIKCIMSHIDYGFQLDFGDWGNGDIGNPYTFNHNIGTITENGEDGYRYLDVTDDVLQDYDMGRILTQYRIAFEVNTDGDSLWDQVWFISGDSPEEYNKPKLFFYFSNSVGTVNMLEIKNSLNCNNFPNPFNPETKIKYELSQNSNVILQIFNVEGQLIETIVNEYQNSGMHSVKWDASNQSSGIYYYRIKNGTKTHTGKCLLLK